MAVGMDKIDEMPVVKDPKDFDNKSGNWLERLIFNNRKIMVIACALVTIVLAYQASKLNLNASFEKMIPTNHPFIKNYLENKGDIRGLGNSMRVVVENTQGDIFDPEYLEVLRQINDELTLTKGVDRAWVKSIWTPAVRWAQVTEKGIDGGTVMPATYDGSPQSLEELRRNIARAGLIGSYVANNFKSSMITVPLLDKDEVTGEPLDYTLLSKTLEKNIRSKQTAKIKVHIVGFAKLVGDMIAGLMQVMSFFAAAALMAAIVIFFYTRCIRSTLLLISCSVVAVIWQLGAVATLGMDLDPYSILVPFLIFAIGVSHGAQKMNGIMQDVGRGTHKYVAARYTFRRLFMAGVTALLADAVGFAVLMMIDIPVIKDLAMTASIGVAVLIFTNLLLLPTLLSFVGVSPAAALRSLREETEENKGKGVGAIWGLLNRFTERRWATGAVVCAGILAVVGFVVSLNLKIGDLDPGAPELRPSSRYNKDNAFITKNYSLSSDQFAAILKTPAQGCLKYETLVEADRLGWALKQVPGVQTTFSLTNMARDITAGSYEGTTKFYTISRNSYVSNDAVNNAMIANNNVVNQDLSVMPIIAYLSDHKAETLDRVVNAASEFSENHSTPDRKFLLVAGNAGIEAVTNLVVRKANRTMMIYVYLAVIMLCGIAFRNWRAVLVAVLPLMLTSILCEALMVVLGIGVKVATLPVIALGVGIGVDYALYLVSVQLAQQRLGLSLTEAYKKAVGFTGKVIGLVGITLAAGVITWAWSPIKFQADMGVLLTFMFIWNMVGALVLSPALSYFLLNEAKDVVTDEALAPVKQKKSNASVSEVRAVMESDLPSL